MQPAPAPEQVRDQLEKLLASKAFERTHRLAGLMRYLVAEALDGRTITEYDIAFEHFGIKDFTPAIDSRVRTAMRDLRGKLRSYYAQEGCADEVLFELPQRVWVPNFVARSAPLTHSIPDKGPADQFSWTTFTRVASCVRRTLNDAYGLFRHPIQNGMSIGMGTSVAGRGWMLLGLATVIVPLLAALPGSLTVTSGSLLRAAFRVGAEVLLGSTFILLSWAILLRSRQVASQFGIILGFGSTGMILLQCCLSLGDAFLSVDTPPGISATLHRIPELFAAFRAWWVCPDLDRATDCLASLNGIFPATVRDDAALVLRSAGFIPAIGTICLGLIVAAVWRGMAFIVVKRLAGASWPQAVAAYMVTTILGSCLAIAMETLRSQARENTCQIYVPQSPTFNPGPLTFGDYARCTDLPLVTVRNASDSASSRDQRYALTQVEQNEGVAVQQGEEVSVRIWINNGASEQDRILNTATNVSALLTVTPDEAGSSHAVNVRVGSSNAPMIDSRISTYGGDSFVKTPPGSQLTYVPGKTILCLDPLELELRRELSAYDQTSGHWRYEVGSTRCGATRVEVSMPDSILSTGLNLGSVRPGYAHGIIIGIRLRVDRKSPRPAPNQ